MKEFVEITPEPEDDERRAILAALTAEAAERDSSPWADAFLPERDDGGATLLRLGPAE